MIVALTIGRENSKGFPGKNIYPVLGRPLMAYSIMAALSAKSVDKVFISTDSDKLKEIAVEYGVEVIDRPNDLASDAALGEHAFVHGYREIVERYGEVEQMVLLFCNAATILANTIDEGINVLKNNSDLDSAVTVSRYNMWSPLRARKIGDDGNLNPFVPFEVFGDPATLNCDRDSQGDVFFADMGASIVRPRCLENLDDGLLPQKWMGNKIYPLKQDGGFDVDYDYQIASVESWLVNSGFTESDTPYDNNGK